MHGLDVAGAEAVLDRADGLEQHAFGDGVEQHQQHGGPDRLLLADAGAGHDEAEVGDGGERQHLFAVVLGDGHHAGGQEGKPADKADHDPRRGAGQRRGQPDKQVDARLDHGGAVQQRAGRRGRDHRPQQPGGKRQLGRFGQRRKGQQRHGDGGAGGDDVRQLHRAVHHRHIDDADGKAEAAEQVHPQRAEAVVDGFLGTGVADEQEGDDAGDLPEEVHPDKVFREDEAEHRGQEQEQHREKEPAAVFVFGVVRVVGFHVADGIDADKPAHERRDQAQKHRQAVQPHMGGLFHRVGDLGPGDEQRLPRRQQNDRVFAVADGQRDDERHEHELAAEHGQVDILGSGALRVERHRLPAAGQPAAEHGQGQRHHAAGRHIGDDAACLAVRNKRHQHRRQRGQAIKTGIISIKPDLSGRKTVQYDKSSLYYSPLLAK